MGTPEFGRSADGSVCLRYSWRENGVVRSEMIEFAIPRAFAYRSESTCRAWHIEGAFETLVEVRDSAWAAEIRADTNEHWRDHFVLNHYLIYLEGAYEVLAASWRVVPVP